MIVCCISDIHGHLIEIEPCDLLIIAGDICGHARYANVGSIDDRLFQAAWLNGAFREWLDKIPAKEVVATAGNHDWVFENHGKGLVPSDLRWHMLIDDVKVIQGKKIYGSPWQHWFYNWAFNAPPRDEGGEEFLERKFSFIPDDTDIIVVHGPPHSFGDAAPRRDGSWELTGSTSLTKRIMTIKPDLSVHGHIHMGNGVWEIERGNLTPTKIVNASICNESNIPERLPKYFEI
jgi:Icc-related predicted phosphoesterase